MEHVVDSLHSMWSRDAEAPVQKRSVNPARRAAESSDTSIEIEGSQLVPLDKDTHPEVPKESTENAEVSLAERALQEVLNQVNLEELAGSDRNAKAAQNDKTKAPTYMWDRWTLPYCNVLSQRRGEPAQHLDWRRSFLLLRLAMLRFWKRSLLRGFVRYRKSEDRPSPVLADYVIEASRDCFSQIGLCSVWAWEDGGSRPFFWNWKEEFHEDLIWGMTMWIREPIVPWTRKQPAPVPQHRQQVLEKLDVIRSRGYVGEGQVESLICFFAVHKGASDIRMVYDGTRSGLNDVLWAPWFPLPTVNSHLWLVEPGTFMADNDVGECFHNWTLDERVLKSCGIDLTSTLKSKERVWGSRWNRCAMGLRLHLT